MKRSNIPFILVCLSACNPTFDPANEVQSVRVLAVQANPPYVTPGATVDFEMLVVDARPSKPDPTTVSWIKAPCANPVEDDYYGCFSAFSGEFQPGVDLTPQLASGTSFSALTPSDLIASHVSSRGGEAYGLFFVFAFACAGHVEYTPTPAGAGPNEVPFGCFDSNERPVGADGFVFTYATVYAFADRTNTNPVIGGLTFNGTPVDDAAGITVTHCDGGKVTDCPSSDIDIAVPASSQEGDPGDLDANGNAVEEEIWVDYYVTGTQMKNDTIILYDPRVGPLGKTSDDLYAPESIGPQQLWAVVHDNRGGVSWTHVPLKSN